MHAYETLPASELCLCSLRLSDSPLKCFPPLARSQFGPSVQLTESLHSKLDFLNSH